MFARRHIPLGLALVATCVLSPSLAHAATADALGPRSLLVLALSLLGAETFHEWRAANDVHMARSEMAPYPYRFYVFENLFSEAYASAPIMSRTPFEPCSRGEKLRRRLAELLLASAAASGPGKSLFLKKFLA
ncbi:MAG: hypothetical protein WCJ30_24465, partial [Deltaproteobacteria bacterium]